MRSLLHFTGLASLLIATPAALAGWNVYDLSPAGSTASLASGIRLGKVSGTVDGNAVLWTGTPGSMTANTLGPGATSGTDGVEVAGAQTGVGVGAWTIAPPSFANLTPVPTPGPNPPYGTFTTANVTGVFDGRESGSFYYQVGAPHAVYWNDAGNQYVDLNDPITNHFSESYGVGFDSANNLVEVGTKWGTGQPNFHAILWHDDNASAIDLNPLTANESRAYAVSFGKEVGYVRLADNQQHAALWTGTAASFVDLHPSAPGVIESVAGAVSYNGIGPATVAGTTYFGSPEVGHASYWDGTAASWVDLQSYLPANYTSSVGSGIWTNNAGISYVSGYAFNTTTGQNEAMLWLQTVPEPAALALFAMPLAILRRRRV